MGDSSTESSATILKMLHVTDAPPGTILATGDYGGTLRVFIVDPASAAGIAATLAALVVDALTDAIVNKVVELLTGASKDIKKYIEEVVQRTALIVRAEVDRGRLLDLLADCQALVADLDAYRTTRTEDMRAALITRGSSAFYKAMSLGRAGADAFVLIAGTYFCILEEAARSAIDQGTAEVNARGPLRNRIVEALEHLNLLRDDIYARAEARVGQLHKELVGECGEGARSCLHWHLWVYELDGHFHDSARDEESARLSRQETIRAARRQVEEGTIAALDVVGARWRALPGPA